MLQLTITKTIAFVFINTVSKIPGNICNNPDNPNWQNPFVIKLRITLHISNAAGMTNVKYSGVTGGGGAGAKCTQRLLTGKFLQTQREKKAKKKGK